MLRKILFRLFMLIGITSFAQQDPLYSQYMFNMVAINPAYTGIHESLNITFNSRFQWTSLDGSPRTNTLSAHSPFFDNKVGLGVILLRDELGVNKNTEGYVSYSYKIGDTEKTFSFGLQTGFVNQSFDYSDLRLRFLDDPQFQPGEQSLTKVNFGAGFIFMTDNIFIGASAPRLLNSDFDDGVVSSSRYERHYYLTGAYLFELARGIKIKPSALIRVVDGAPLSFDLSGSVFLNNQFWVGIYTRDFNAYGLMGQFEFMDAYKIGYAFEIPSGNFIGTNLLTHEIMISVDLAILSNHAVYQRYF